jgi:hypothetical protein
MSQALLMIEEKINQVRHQPDSQKGAERARLTRASIVNKHTASNVEPLSWGNAATSLMMVLLIAFLGAIVLYAQKPPDAVAVNAPLTEFSSARAMKHLETIAQRPHPTGSEEHAQVRSYILAALTAEGLQTEVQTTPVVNNILARLKGTGEGKALLLVAHYDTVPSSPGAGDDGSAVVMMLETLRALKVGPPLMNDVIFLFSDGEEKGLLGAKAFTYNHPWARDVGLVLNFDARGTRGAALMFETSQGNGWLIRQFAQASPYPLASSFMQDVYHLLPNSTDFTIFKEAGLRGLNFAFIDGSSNYHSERDNLKNIDERSIQHEGSNALALTRHFGNVSLENSSAGDAVYFNLPGSTMIIYSMKLVLPLTLAVSLLYVALIVYGFRKERLTARGIAQGCLVIFLCVVSAALILTVIQPFLPSLRSAPANLSGENSNRSDLFMLSFVALTLAISSALHALFRRRASVENLMVGGLLWWVILMVLTSLYFPGASYLFTWPLLFSLVWCGLKLFRKERESELFELLAAQVFAIIAAMLIVTPAIYIIYVALTLNGAVPVMMLVALLSGLLIPHFKVMALANRWLWPSALGLIGVGLMVAGSL